MKLKTHEAASRLGVHPADLLLHLTTLGAEFDDAWPEVDSSWVEAVRASDWARFGGRAESKEHGESPGTVKQELAITSRAVLVIEKLWRNGRWGKLTVSPESIQHHTHLGRDEVDRAVAELLARDLLVASGRHGPYGLNSARKGEIEKIVRQVLDDR